MRCVFLWFAVVGVLVAGGCDQSHYQIRITPTDSGFDRTLTCWIEGSGDPPSTRPLDTEELAKIQACYGSKPERGREGRDTFRGKFTVETPQDVGGAGRLERIDTSLGTMWIYAERFRGNDDLESQLESRREAIDVLTDLTLGWLRKEFGGQPNFERLERFVDKTVRHDLKNLAVYLWVLKTREDLEWFGKGLEERFWLLGSEHGYITLHDLAAIRASGGEDLGPILKVFARLVARELEVEPTSDALSIFRDVDRLTASWNEHVRASEYFAAYARSKLAGENQAVAKVPQAVSDIIRDMEKRRGDASRGNAQQPEPSPEGEDLPTPHDAMKDLLLEAFLQFDMSPGASVEVTLQADAEPISTNGTWNEAEKTVTWKKGLSGFAALPTVYAATWTVANAAEQRKRFGEVFLTGQELADYAFWHESLSKDEAAQWHRVLDACKADGDWRKAVESFQFDEKTDVKKALADTVKQLLIEDDEDGK